MTYDNGELMSNFLNFVCNNKHDNKCRMLFIYGATLGRGCSCRYLNKLQHDNQNDKDYIISTIRGMMAKISYMAR